MEPHAPLFPSFVAPLGDLYGAGSFRAAEAHASALDLDELDREELALERTVRALVDRPAPQPIGLKFHRATPSGGRLDHSNTTHSSALDSSVLSGGARPRGGNGQRLQRGGVAPVGTEGSRLGSGVQTSRGYHGDVAAASDDDDEDDEMEEDDDLEELEDEEEEDEDDEGEEDDDELFAGDEDDHEGGAGERDHDDAASDSMDTSM